jgi:hypothetical protein
MSFGELNKHNRFDLIEEKFRLTKVDLEERFNVMIDETKHFNSQCTRITDLAFTLEKKKNLEEETIFKMSG